MRFWRNIKDLILSYRYPYGKYFLVSFPKTGRTWLLHMLHHIQEESKSDIFIESTHDMSEIIIENGFRQDPNFLFNFPNRFRYRRSKVLFLVRDPRDVIVSHFYQVTKRSKNPFIFSSISDFVRDETLGFRRIIYFYNLWFKSKTLPKRFCLIKYEDLLENGISELKRICAFISIPCDDSIIEKVYLASSASKMRKQEIDNKIDGFNDFGKEKNQLKVRNAKIGSYLQELNKEDIDYCNIEMKSLNDYFNYSE